MEQAFLNAGRPRCGLRINRGKTFYNGGRLKETHPGAAVFEVLFYVAAAHPSDFSVCLANVMERAFFQLSRSVLRLCCADFSDGDCCPQGSAMQLQWRHLI